MLTLEELRPGLPLVGLEPSSVATVAAVVPIGDGVVQVFYRTPDGTTKERLLGRDDEANLSVASHEGPYYIRRPFDREPGWGVSSINYNLSDLLSRAEPPFVTRSVSEGSVPIPASLADASGYNSPTGSTRSASGRTGLKTPAPTTKSSPPGPASNPPLPKNGR